MWPWQRRQQTWVLLVYYYYFVGKACPPSCRADRAYPLGCSQRPRSYYDYHQLKSPQRWPAPIRLRPEEAFARIRPLGSGRFSEVWEAVDLEKLNRTTKLLGRCPTDGGGRVDQPVPIGCKSTVAATDASFVVLKDLKPVSPHKVWREILILYRARHVPHVVRLLAVTFPWPTSSEEETMQPQSSNETHPSTTVTGAAETRVMPSLVLQHAGPHAQWLCHDVCSQIHRRDDDDDDQYHHHDSDGDKDWRRQRCPTTGHDDDRPPKELGEVVQDEEEAIHNVHHDDDVDETSFLTNDEIRYYLYHLLVALDGLHSCSIMHRDIKPNNIMINRNVGLEALIKQQKKSTSIWPPLLLIDLGLADFYLPQRNYPLRVASRHYKSPELLLGYSSYDYAIDLWAVGCILAGLLFRREPFFHGQDNLDQLIQIITVLGVVDLIDYIDEFRMDMSDEALHVVQRYLVPLDEDAHLLEPWPRPRQWNAFRREGCPRPDDDALDLLNHLLVYHHERRYTARQAMQHAYFDTVRHLVQTEKSMTPTESLSQNCYE